MNFISTRGTAPAVPLDTALQSGVAPDDGLYVPEVIPLVPNGALAAPGATLAETAAAVLAPYFAGSRPGLRLADLCSEAFSFDAPLVGLRGPHDMRLELFHGPTAAFKDYAARFLARALSAIRDPGAPVRTILVATSGDTGAAVAAAFHDRRGFRVSILYPDGKVSPRQAHGLACWGPTVTALAVAGDFDACQRLVRRALADPVLGRDVPLSSANSISLGRLLPQMAYYAHAAAGFHRRSNDVLNLIVPTGNLGNACAAYLARRMGAPIGDIHLACNANDTLPRYFAGGDYAPRPSRSTLANAMDVGAPGNFERLRHWHGNDDEVLRKAFGATAVDDGAIREAIRTAPERHGVVPCPHTATGLHVLDRLRAAGDTRPWAVVATAHPAKFETIVEPLVGHTIAPPPALAACLARPAVAMPLEADYAALRQALLKPQRGGSFSAPADGGL